MEHRNRYHVPGIPVRDFILHFILLTALLAVGFVAPLQTIAKTDNALLHWKIYEDHIHGFKIEYLGELIEYANTEVCLRLSLEVAVVHILVDSEPSVLLSETYGGRYYFEEYPGAPALANRVLSQEVVLNGVLFKKDYWVVYGGAGAWDTVINYYTAYRSNYYIISLHHRFVSGIPGMVVDGKRKLTEDDMINNALSEMLNDDNLYVSMFDKILCSFRLTE